MLKSRVFNFFNFKGQKQECDFSHLEEIECCTFNEFEINDEIIAEINKMKNLNMLVFNHCTFNNSKKIERGIENLVVTYSKNFRIDYIENAINIKNLILTCLDKIDINGLKILKNIEKLSIFECDIINFSQIENLKSIRELSLDGSSIDDDEKLNSLKNTIKLQYNKDYHIC